MLFTKHENPFLKILMMRRSFALLHGHETTCVYRLKPEADMSDF